MNSCIPCNCSPNNILGGVAITSVANTDYDNRPDPDRGRGCGCSKHHCIPDPCAAIGLMVYGGRYNNTTQILSIIIGSEVQVPLPAIMPHKGIGFAFPNSIAVGQTGVYEINYGLLGQFSLAADLTVAVRRNGVALPAATVTRFIELSTDASLNGSFLVNLVAGDVIDLTVSALIAVNFTLGSGVSAQLTVKKID